MDCDGDEFMAPASAAATAAAAPAQAASSHNQFARPSSTATLDSDRFAFPKDGGASTGAFKDAGPKNFTKQYAAIYFSRLTALKPAVLAQAQKALPNFAHAPFVSASGAPPPVCARILDMVPDQWCVIAGTLYKDMKLKPSILEEYAKTSGHAVSTTADGSVYVSDDDTLILEDEQGRVQLTGTADHLSVSHLVSGVVVAVLGREVAGGKFEVHALWTPEMAPQKPLPALMMQEKRAPAYMLVVSGLSLGQPGVDPTPVQMLMDYATGLLGSTAEQRSSASIVRVMIAGNALHRYDKRTATGAGSASANKAAARDFGREDTEHDDSVAPLRELDLLLTPLAAAVPVDIFPGESDPSNFTLPQQPFHKCLFPSASSFSTFTRTTNPCWLQVEGVQVLATAGQNVADLAKYSTAANNSDYLESSLRWRCVAPTAPDTLGCYPYQRQDPFVLTESPHLYIVGNQGAFSSNLVRGADGQQVRTVCVPAFSATGTAVLIDLHSQTLDAKPISFKLQTE